MTKPKRLRDKKRPDIRGLIETKGDSKPAKKSVKKAIPKTEKEREKIKGKENKREKEKEKEKEKIKETEKIKEKVIVKVDKQKAAPPAIELGEASEDINFLSQNFLDKWKESLSEF